MSYLLRRLPGQLARCAVTATPRVSRSVVPKFSHCRPRAFSITLARLGDKYEEEAKRLNQKGLDEHEQEVRVRQHQVKRPWHRQDADKPPVDEKGETEERLTTGTCHRSRWRVSPR